MSNLIVKKLSTQPLKLNESAKVGEKKYVFEGIFTPIGIKNRNERIYDEDEVLKHLAYLREKIKKEGCILGELDHPEGRFEIYMKEVSHKITDLWYDPKQKCVMGRLELLDTDNGQKMKKMVDAGVPLYVSSRAAGTVGSDSHVSIQQIFTYDIVATPGFEQCKLDAVSESAKSVIMNFINESKSAKKAINQASKYGVLEEGINIIETNEKMPELNERKKLNIDMTNLTQPLMNEDIKVKVSPEKAQELGLNLNNNTSDETQAPTDQASTEEKTKDDILDITPTYAEQNPSAIEDIQPEFNSAETGEQNTNGESETTGINQSENPFMMESAKPKKSKKSDEVDEACCQKSENKQEPYDEKQKLDEGGENPKVAWFKEKVFPVIKKWASKIKATAEMDKYSTIIVTTRKGYGLKELVQRIEKANDFYNNPFNIKSDEIKIYVSLKDGAQAGAVIQEEEKPEKPNPVADGKLGSSTDQVQHVSNNKEKHNEKTMKNDDSETVQKLKNKKKEVTDSLHYNLDYYNSILEEQNVKAKIKQSIINRFPFAVSLSESNFDKFATLSEEEKKTCADYIFENQIWDIRQINEQFMRPLFDKINEQKNYLRLADKSDLELYNNAPRELKESINKMAELYILESKADVDEFWARTGIRNFAKNQVQNETFVQNFNEKMAVSEEDNTYNQFGYDKNFIDWVASKM